MRQTSPSDRWLVPGHNCREVARADRVGVLVDAEAYFTALYDALCAARHSVFIVGWDIDSRVRLVRDAPDGPYPQSLAALLHELACERPSLRIHILVWDYAAIYLFEREPMQRMRFTQHTQPRVRFAVDDCHPIGGSLHEKLVVVDDRVAFCGGLDVCDVRWDTPEHRADDARRVSHIGRHYPPHHDVQAVVDGDAAAALGRIARERWHRATGETIDTPKDDHDPWPRRAAIDMRGVDVGIARTRYGEGADEGVREVEMLWLDSIARAERLVYVESPYLTSRRIADAIAHRLRRRDCPETIFVMPRRLNGWFENATMGMAGDRMISKLREIDRYERLHVFTPVSPRPDGEPAYVNVHSKLAIVDDKLLRIGSANTTDRSMRLDCECDIAVEARDAATAAAIADVRERLMAEHARVEVHELRQAIARERSTANALRKLGERTRALYPYEPSAARTRDRFLLDVRIVDPARPLTFKELGRVLLRGNDRRATWWRRVTVGWWVTALAFVLVANLFDWIDSVAISAWLVEIGTTRPWAVLAIMGLFTIAGMMFVPVTLMIVNCGLLFGPWLGVLYGLAGALTSAAIYHALGRGIGRDLVHRLAGPRLRAATEAIARKGLLAVVAARVVPVAPHFVVGVAAGASRIGFRDYMLGTSIAMAPGGVVLVLFGHALGRGSSTPSVQALGLAVTLAAGVLVVGWLLQRLVGEREPAAPSERQDAGAR